MEASQSHENSVATGVGPKLVNAFEYTPLASHTSSIRLIHLQPSEDCNSPVEVAVVEAPFGDKPKYEALSYTWGSDAAQHDIRVDGKRFLVRPNLLEALMHLRGLSETRVLWIDAICINQADIEERNRQLYLMPHIYGRAQMVLVWLGHDDSLYHSTLSIYSNKINDSYSEKGQSNTIVKSQTELSNLCQRDY
jgi:hypothetical protein